MQLLQLARRRATGAPSASTSKLEANSAAFTPAYGLAVAVSIDASALHHGSEVPRHEFVLTVAVQLALALVTRGGGEDQFEETLAHLLDGRGPVDDLAAIDIDVFRLALPQ